MMKHMLCEIQLIQAKDIPFVINLARNEGFAPGVGDVNIYANTDLQGVWISRLGSNSIGCIAGIKYNLDYGFIGLYVVDRPYRGKGYGTQLWERALSHLDNVKCIGLEAAPSLVGQYKKWGFQEDSITTRWQLLNLLPGCSRKIPESSYDLEVVSSLNISVDAIQKYDVVHEISPRPHFLSQWLNHPAGDVFSAVDTAGSCHGYLRIRPCLLLIGEGWRIGPLLAQDQRVALLLLNSIFSSYHGVILIDSPGHNRSATALLKSCGFKEISSTTRMYRGKIANRHDADIFGLACLELG
ncbi:N-acetyltransferase [cyanobiont of Ornithocercus magnificus]|nr:N-acetyltransferase [cyanobiont of Ornithocercus magnificus]